MINYSDIEAFEADLTAADKIVERAKKGVPAGRHIMLEEELPLIRAFVLMRNIAEESADFFAELHAREIEGMGLGPTKPKR